MSDLQNLPTCNPRSFDIVYKAVVDSSTAQKLASWKLLRSRDEKNNEILERDDVIFTVQKPEEENSSTTVVHSTESDTHPLDSLCAKPEEWGSL